MYITQSALSQQLAKLKQEGVPPLFREEKKKMVLTDAGKIYLNGARAILREEALAQKKLNSLNDEDKVVFDFSEAFDKTEADVRSTAFDKRPVTIPAENSYLRERPVTIPAENSYLREILDRIFSEESNIPEIYTETNDFNIALSLVKNGECKAVIPRSLVKVDGLRIEAFKDPCYFYLTAIHKKTTSSPIIDAAVKELKRYFIA